MALHSSSYFFRLPRELKDQIYHRLWSNTLLGFRHKEFVVIARYEVTANFAILKGLPAWLITNRQFLEEGMQQFFDHAQFTVGEGQSFPFYEVRSVTSPPEFPPLITSYVSTHIDVMREMGICLHPIPDASSRLLCLTHTKKLRVKNITITLDVCYDSRENCVDPQSVLCDYIKHGCCTPHISISATIIAPSLTHQDTNALLAILNDRENPLQDLELCVTGTDIDPNDDHIISFLKAKPQNPVLEIRHDWTFFDRLPKTLHKLSISIPDDVKFRKWFPENCVVVLEEMNRKCGELVSITLSEKKHSTR
ncbi:hypothetical protein CC86DRAFT_15217 [Ophiobolus disseminans]|uniref:F-box domain-containing protein n=1 Tax=Ophiobolus disseminans TaxID=1469910 RepID=A0A6A7AKW3_9PLEO|nr:hypothetical protein CC86DRAFT_15217 [Ophiobolus disseminans]